LDSQSNLAHLVATSAASVATKNVLPDQLHGEEKKLWGDGAYQGQSHTIREAAPQAQDMTHHRTRFKNYVDELQRRKNATNSKVSTKLEDVFRVLKRQFDFDRVGYRSLAKNHNRLCACFAMVNLYNHRKRLLAQRA
jgi:IS5 family transposase